MMNFMVFIESKCFQHCHVLVFIFKNKNIRKYTQISIFYKPPESKEEKQSVPHDP